MTNNRTALITGILGQDGSYLAELLLQKGYTVIGMDHAAGAANAVQSTAQRFARVQSILGSITLAPGDLADQASLLHLIETYQPDEVYNLAAHTFVPASWGQIVCTGEINALGVARLLDSIHQARPQARFLQASSSEVFGHPIESPQRENTPFSPRTPYGIAKAYAHWTTVNYRQSFGLFAVAAILYNHESERRPPDFVTRKITQTAARIKLGLADQLPLGSLDARRDWGFAGDYVEALWRMVQHEPPEDFVIGSGETHTVREFCQLAFGRLDLDYRDYVIVDPRFVRPPEPVQLIADPTNARQKLAWQPTLTFEQLVQRMVDADLQQLKQGISRP